MLELGEVADAAKRELGAALTSPVKIACPSCGWFVVNVFVVPNLVRGRCAKCRVDVVALIGRERTVMAITEKSK
jgi:hypothetical protein